MCTCGDAGTGETICISAVLVQPEASSGPSIDTHSTCIQNPDSPADTTLIKDVTSTIAGARGDPVSTTHSTKVHDLVTVCHAVAPRAARAVPTTHTACIHFPPSAVALARGDARATADSAFVKKVAIAVTCAMGNASSSVASRAARSVPSTHPAPIYRISSAVALARGDARATTHLYQSGRERERKERESEAKKDRDGARERNNERERTSDNTKKKR